MSQPDDSQLKGFSKAFWSGITTVELVEVLKWAIEENVVGLKQIAPCIIKLISLICFNYLMKFLEKINLQL